MIKFPAKWPYKPPHQRLNVRWLSSIWRPPGYILLSETIDKIGQATLGEKWTGEELCAREITGTIPCPPSEAEDTWVGFNRLPVDHTHGPGWRVTTVPGHVVVKSEEAARSLWATERPKLFEMWRAETSARRRFREIEGRLRTDLYAERRHARLHCLTTGKLFDIPGYIWGREGLEVVFELGDDSRRWANPNILKIDLDPQAVGDARVEGRVVLDESQLEDMCQNTAGGEMRCRNWLASLMAAGDKEKVKNEYMTEAREEFGVGKRSFVRAWDSAIAKTGNTSWSKPGRKRRPT